MKLVYIPLGMMLVFTAMIIWGFIVASIFSQPEFVMTAVVVGMYLFVEEVYKVSSFIRE